MSKNIYNKFHYVYRITNTLLNKHYYGYRSCFCNPKEDLGIHYFSSSTDKNFILDQKENKVNYKYKIIRVYKTREDALKLEIKLHNKFNVDINESFYNLIKQPSVKYSFSGMVHSEESKQKMSNSAKKRPKRKLLKEHKKRLSLAAKKRNPMSEETRLKISLSNKGRKQSKEERKKRSIAYKGRIQTQETRDKIAKSNSGENNHNFSGYFIAPFGIFSSSRQQTIIHHKTLIKWCKNNENIITPQVYHRSEYLKNNYDNSIIGKTIKTLGFDFLPK
jgi:hypothetical protein